MVLTLNVCVMLNLEIVISMKIVLFILSLVFLTSCTTPEKRIKKSFNLFREDKITNIEVYDTVSKNDIYESIDTFHTKIKSMENSIKRIEIYNDSIIDLNLNKSELDSFIKLKIDQKSKYKRELDIMSFKQGIVYNLYSDMNDTIAGYYARIITPIDTFNIIVNPRFEFVCPVFMYENDNKNERDFHNRRN